MKYLHLALLILQTSLILWVFPFPSAASVLICVEGGQSLASIAPVFWVNRFTAVDSGPQAPQSVEVSLNKQSIFSVVRNAWPWQQRAPAGVSKASRNETIPKWNMQWAGCLANGSWPASTGFDPGQLD